MKKLLSALTLLLAITSQSQLVINELDTDTPSTDDREFIELKSDTPNFPLDGYVIVMFNGSATSSTGNKSYYTIDLDGYSTDVNGLLLLGNNNVSPVPELIFPVSIMQNGADAVAIYQGSSSDFPVNTLATTVNLIDALVYGTSDPDASDLMSLLGISFQVDENANNASATQSIQLGPGGTYTVAVPTPGVNNDGSGFIFNGIQIQTSASTLNEGDSFTITFTTQQPVNADLFFSFTLNNSSFNSSDYTGSLNISIPAGQSTASADITLIDDTVDDGDELAMIRFGALPFGYNRVNDNIEVRVIDNDFTIAPWGTPLNPTFDVVQSTAPIDYYAALEGKAGSELRQAIQDIIADPAVVRAHNYGDVEYILKDADENPLNSNEVWLMYVEQGRAKYKFQTTASNVGSWNREHIFPQSRGGFSNGTEATPDGINTYLPTNADDILAGHADAHHIRSEDGPENTLRSNRDYGSDYNGPAGNSGSWKGDVARSLFYMELRYNGLSLVNGNPPDTTVGQLGDLASLLAWNQIDPSDDFEMNRNNIIYTWQFNRNPFIDFPELADYIWGANAGEVWSFSLAAAEQSTLAAGIFPNPVINEFSVYGIDSGIIEIFNVSGAKLISNKVEGINTIRIDLPSGFYIARVTSNGKSATKKLIVR